MPERYPHARPFPLASWGAPERKGPLLSCLLLLLFVFLLLLVCSRPLRSPLQTRDGSTPRPLPPGGNGALPPQAAVAAPSRSPHLSLCLPPSPDPVWSGDSLGRPSVWGWTETLHLPTYCVHKGALGSPGCPPIFLSAGRLLPQTCPAIGRRGRPKVSQPQRDTQIQHRPPSPTAGSERGVPGEPSAGGKPGASLSLSTPIEGGSWPQFLSPLSHLPNRLSHTLPLICWRRDPGVQGLLGAGSSTCWATPP